MYNFSLQLTAPEKDIDPSVDDPLNMRGVGWLFYNLELEHRPRGAVRNITLIDDLEG